MMTMLLVMILMTFLIINPNIRNALGNMACKCLDERLFPVSGGLAGAGDDDTIPEEDVVLVGQHVLQGVDIVTS